jgi:kynureninase
MELDLSLHGAQMLDQQDPLAHFRNHFSFPEHQGGDSVYLCGNSLGLQPASARQRVEEVLDDWSRYGVEGHFSGASPWMPYHEFVAEDLRTLTGARSTAEVVCMNSLTVNLHLMMVSFYQPRGRKRKILLESQPFPSDIYAAKTQIQWHGGNPEDDVLLVHPRPGEHHLRTEDILATIEEHQDTLALILLPGVQYYTGQWLDIEAITRAANAAGIIAGWDLAHAVGNVPLQLHAWEVDFAVWCSYKYLNSGPGSLAGCFVHEKHHGSDKPRFGGWWGHDKSTRFEMGPDFVPIAGAEGWQLSNPPVLSLAAVRGSLEVFRDAGGMLPLRQKSEAMTSYLETLLLSRLGERISIITPQDPMSRGAQLSLTLADVAGHGKAVHRKLMELGAIVDWREPDAIRVAPAPLYNSFEDCYRFVEMLQEALDHA